MQYRIPTDPKKLIGKRPNLAAEKSVTDEIVSAFSVPPEDMPLPPLSPLPAHTPASATAPAAPRKRKPQGLTIAATVLNVLPFIYPLFFYVHGWTSGHPLPFYLYPILVSAVRFIPFLGGLLLYLAARAANAFRKPIGWIALANVVFSLGSVFFLTEWLPNYDPSMLSRSDALGFLLFSAVSLLSMVALCVFSVVMLARVFNKGKRSNDQKNNSVGLADGAQ